MKSASTKKMGTKAAGAFVLIMSLLFSIYLQNADAESPQYYIDIGEPDLYSKSIDRALAAYGNFLNAKADLQATNDPVINAYLAFTRMIYYAFTGDPIGAEDLMGRYGVSRTGDDEYTLQYDLPLDINDKLHVPGNAPTGETVRAYLHNELLSAVDESLSNLEITLGPGGWNSSSKHIAPVANTGRDMDLEIDYGDILLFRACLKALKSIILIASAYDLDIDLREIAALENLEALKIKDVLDRYLNFLTLLPDPSNVSVDGAALLDQARSSLIAAINDYMDASDEILNDVDTESGAEELTEIDECDRRLENWIRTNLTAIRNSLEGSGDPVVDIVNEQDEWQFADDSIPPNYFKADFDLDMSAGDYSSLNGFDFVGSDGEIVCITITGNSIYLELEDDSWPYNEVQFNGTISPLGNQISGSYTGWSEARGFYSGDFTAVLNGSVTETDSINLNPFFGNGSGPFDVRDFLPDFDECDNALENTVGYGLNPSDPDETLRGIFPAYTQDDWGINPEICSLGDATINGNLSVPFYSGEGTIFIQAFRYNGGFDTSPENRLGIQTIYADEFTEGMSYEIPDVESGTDVFISAWWDLNSNGIFDPGETEQIWGPDYLPSGSTVTADLTLQTGFTVLGSVINVRQPGGGFQTLIEVAFGDDFTGTLPDDIDTITIESPSGPLPYGKNDFTYHTEFEEFYIFIPGSPEIGIYTFTVTGGGVSGTATDYQYVLRTFPLQDTTAFSPAAGTVVSSKTPIFEWGAVEYDSDPSIPLYYRLLIHEDVDGEVGQRIFNTGRIKDMLYYTLPENVLTPGATYWWQVRIGDSGDWIKAQNRVVSEWIPFTVADPLSPHSNQPAIDLDGWGVVSWTYNVGQTGTEAWVKINDHDGVASDGSSHSVTIQTPANPAPQPMYFARSDGPGLAAYEFWSDNPPLSGGYTFRVTDPDGNVATIIETLDPADVNPLDPPDANSITPNLLTDSITAAFDNISVRKDGDLEPYEDFNSYSSMDDIDWSKWSWDENASIQRDNGNGWLVLHAGNSVGRSQGVLSFADPNSINEIQIDVAVTDINEIVGEPRARIRGTWCNNGIGDIGASLSLFGGRVSWWVEEEFLNEQETWQWADGEGGDLLTGLQVGDIVTLSISLVGNDLIFSAEGPSGSSGPGTYTYTVTNNLGPPIIPEKSLQNRIHLYTDTTPTFTWNPVSGANRYRVRIYNYDNSQTIWRDYTGSTSYTVPPAILNPNSYYRFRLEAWDSHSPLNMNNVSKTPSSSNGHYIFFTSSHTEADDYPFIDLSNHGVHNWYSEAGSYLQFWIRVHDAQGVPGNIDYVKVIHPDLEEEFLEQSCNNPYSGPTPTSCIYYLDSALLPIDGGTYTFEVADNEGHTYQVSEELTNKRIGAPARSTMSPEEGDVVGRTAVSFFWTTPPFTPPADVAFYTIAILDYDYNLLYQFHTTESFYNLPEGFLEYGKIYRWRLMTRGEFFSQNADNMSGSPATYLGAIPFATTPPVDNDGDLIPDYWEELHGLDPDNLSDAGWDLDEDGLTSLEEFQRATNPFNADTDNDGEEDDSDALPLNGDEIDDTDADGIGDNSDLCYNDAGNDLDLDGLCEARENAIGTNPSNPDSDGDTHLDGEDAFPLDENEWADSDGDGVGDNSDNCPFPDNPKVPYVAGESRDDCAETILGLNPDNGDQWQPDYDCDGIGNPCDPDADNDGALKAEENEGDDCDDLDENVFPGCPDTTPGCPCETDTSTAPPASVNTCKPNKDDCDGDGVVENIDTCPGLNAPQTDTDGDGYGDACDNCPDVYNENQEYFTFYKDQDGDWYSDGTQENGCAPSAPYFKLSTDSQWEAFSGDCDDNDISVNPGSSDVLKDCDPANDPVGSGAYDIKVDIWVNDVSKDYGTWEPNPDDQLLVVFKALDGNTELSTDPANPPYMQSNFALALAAGTGGDNPTRYLGQYLNGPDLDDSGDFDPPVFGTNQVQMTCRDSGGAIIISASVTIVIDGAGNTETISKDFYFPKDSDHDGIADFYENLYGNLDPLADDDNDGLINLNEYRAKKWGRTQRIEGDVNSVYDTAAYVPDEIVSLIRTNPNHRDLFVRHVGFDATHPFAVGEAFHLLASPVDIHALSDSQAANLGEYNIDVATVTLLDAAMGTQNPHIYRRAIRDWSFRTLGKASFGTDELYGATCFVYKQSIDKLFSDKPHHDWTTYSGTKKPHFSNPAYWVDGPNNGLDGIKNVEDQNDNGVDNSEDDTGNGRLDGDYPVPIDLSTTSDPAYSDPGAPPAPTGVDNDGNGIDIDLDGDGKDDQWDFRFELSPFNVDNDTAPVLVELPVIGSAAEAIDPLYENGIEQVVKMMVTHELGHNVGVDLHTNNSDCTMNSETNNFVRDNFFSSTAEALIRIHNTPIPQQQP